MTTHSRYAFFESMSLEHAIETVCEAHNLAFATMSWQEKDETEEFVLKVAKKFGYHYNLWSNEFHRRAS